MEKMGSNILGIEDAVAKVQETATAKFDESLEIAVVLGVDSAKSDQMVRGSVSLPNGTGKDVRVAVVAEDEKDITQAKEAGAVLAGKDDVIEAIKKGNLDFDVLIATPTCMKDLGRYGKVLGPKGLMPSPKSGTVTKDVAEVVKKVKMGQVTYKMDKNGVVHGMIGKVSFPKEKLVENFNHYIETLKKARPASAKGKYIKNVAIASTMGPSVTVSL